MLNDQATSAAIYKQLFTDAEWDAISSALNDYSDYGDEEANIADSIQAKIATIYKLTEAWVTLIQHTILIMIAMISTAQILSHKLTILWQILMLKISLKWDMIAPIVKQ